RHASDTSRDPPKQIERPATTTINALAQVARDGMPRREQRRDHFLPVGEVLIRRDQLVFKFLYILAFCVFQHLLKWSDLSSFGIGPFAKLERPLALAVVVVFLTVAQSSRAVALHAVGLRAVEQIASFGDRLGNLSGCTVGERLGNCLFRR